MEMQTSEELANLAELYQQLLKNEVSEAAAVALIQEIGKTQRAMLMNREKGKGDSPATYKQISKLRFMGVEVPENITKREASRMIDEALKNQ